MGKQRYTLTLGNGQTITGYCNSKAVLSAHFQQWARRRGLSDDISYACLIHNSNGFDTFGKSKEEIAKLAQKGFELLKGVIIPDLSSI